MTLIGAPHGRWFARFETGTGGESGENADQWEQEISGTAYEPVIAWDGGGYAMVLDAAAGKLTRADGVPGFTGVCDAEEAGLATMSSEELRERHERARR